MLIRPLFRIAMVAFTLIGGCAGSQPAPMYRVFDRVEVAEGKVAEVRTTVYADWGELLHPGMRAWENFAYLVEVEFEGKSYSWRGVDESVDLTLLDGKELVLVIPRYTRGDGQYLALIRLIPGQHSQERRLKDNEANRLGSILARINPHFVAQSNAGGFERFERIVSREIIDYEDIVDETPSYYWDILCPFQRPDLPEQRACLDKLVERARAEIPRARPHLSERRVEIFDRQLKQQLDESDQRRRGSPTEPAPVRT